jgi:hypothetical protein
MDFNLTPFELSTLTGAVNRVPFQPGMITARGSFAPRPQATDTALFDYRDGQLRVVDPVAASAPGVRLSRDAEDRQVAFAVPTYKIEDTLLFASIQGRRAFGIDGPEVVEAKRDERLGIARQTIETTRELCRVAAMTRGQVLRQNGSVITDFYAAFGVSAPAVVTFDPGSTGAQIRKAAAGYIRTLVKTLGVAPPRVIALCGPEYFDRLVGAKEVRETYLNQQAANELREGQAWSSLNYGGILWIEYQGWLPNGDPVIPADKAYVVPEGLPGHLVEVQAPAPYGETINTLAIPVYAKAEPRKFNDGVEIQVIARFLPVNTRPEAIVPLSLT